MSARNLARKRFHLFAALGLLLAGSAVAQHPAPAGSDIAVFGGYISVKPDYDTQFGSQRNNGYFGGFDYTYYGFHLPHGLAPSLELRGFDAKGSNVDVGGGMAGPRIQTTLARRFHPYADMLFGFGDIYFHHITAPYYQHDSAIVYSPGIGVDVDLAFHLQAKADFQYQFWNLGGDPFQPNTFAAGLSYRFPLRSR